MPMSDANTLAGAWVPDHLTQNIQRLIFDLGNNPGTLTVAVAFQPKGARNMNSIIYIVGLVVVVGAILSFVGLA
ncbi:hypothetical protein SAMN05880593_11856 [Rhizobium sp. RU36D]|nr:hypothetical protein SAMN05880593_11856 [Rhizobium sp. RU36D]